jgi:hypothetical protein
VLGEKEEQGRCSWWRTGAGTAAGGSAGGWATVAQAWAKETAAASVRGCEGRRRAGARGKSRAGYVGSRDAMRRLGLRENL